MSAKGVLVKYTRLFKKGPLTPADKKDLKEEINALIDQATDSIAVDALVKVPDEKK